MFSDHFYPLGNTQLVKGTTTASAALQASTAGCDAVQIYPGSTALFLVAFGPSTATAALPTTGTPANGIPLQANVPKIFQIPLNGWFSVIASTAGGTADVYVTPGRCR